MPARRNFKGTVYRYEYPERVGTTWHAHKGNVNAVHRYSGKGRSGIYAGTTRRTAAKEVASYGQLEGRIAVRRNVSVDNVLDLNRWSVRRRLGIRMRDIAGTGPGKYRMPHIIGNWARQNGYNGLLVPSAQNKFLGLFHGKNLVVFGGL